MVQEMIDKLAEVEARQIYLKEKVRQAIECAKIAMDMMNDTDNEIFNMRQEIEIQITSN